MTLAAQVLVHRGGLVLDAKLHAEPGETVAVLGPNGAGKTTLLRALAGLVRLDEGRMEVGGRILEDTGAAVWIPPEGRHVAVVFQPLTLFPHLDVLDNVAFGLRARGVVRDEARRASRVWLIRLGLESLATMSARALSGGQAQRVALAQALVTNPRLLLLDEPLASVDASARVEVRRVMRELLSEYDGIRVLVTHDPLEAAAVADRVVVLEAGHVTQVGGFAEIAARPRSAWVARMVGLNLIEGDARDGRLRLANGVELSILGDVTGRVLATIHPRAVSLHRSRPEGSPRNVMQGNVTGIDREGDRWRVEVDGALPLVAEVTAAAAGELRLADGGRLFAAVKATEVEVYGA